MALAFLAKCYFLLSKIDYKFFIVDHKLRKDSLKEARSVKIFLKKFDIDCFILTWTGKKPTSNIQSIARNHRYDILKKPDFKNQDSSLKGDKKSKNKCTHAFYRLNLFINKNKVNQIKLIEQLNKKRLTVELDHARKFIERKYLRN